MQTTTPPPTPVFTLTQLRNIQQEVTAARQELLEMIEIANFQAIWNVPRKYFVPEIATLIPFPNGHLIRHLKPVWRVSNLDDPVRRAVVNDILLTAQWFELARRDLIPEQFKKEEGNEAYDSERFSPFW